jgi:hypothetical protein
VLSLVGSNVQPSYFEQILLAVADKMHHDHQKMSNGPPRLTTLTRAGICSVVELSNL